MKCGFPKVSVSGAGSFTPPVVKKLSRDSQIGDYVSTNTGYTGVLIGWKFYSGNHMNEPSVIAIFDDGNTFKF